LPARGAQARGNRCTASAGCGAAISAQIAGRYKDETQARVEALTAGLTRAFQGSDGAIYFHP